MKATPSKLASKSKATSSGRKGKLRTHDSLGRKLGEKAIQSSILHWLKTTGLLYYRQNAGELFTGRRKVYLGPKGIPDIIIIIPPNGRFVGLEVKVPRRYQNPDQRAFQARVEASGGVYKVVRSLDEAKEFMCRIQQPQLLTVGMTGQSTPSTLDAWS